MVRNLGYLAAGAVLTLGLIGCNGVGPEPSETEMREAMLFVMNHPPDGTKVIPITIKFFKKEACNKPNEQGFHCTFDVTVASSNLGASFYNAITMGDFYRDKDSGKWAMRPPL